MENGFSLVADAFKQVNQVRVNTNTGLSVASEMLSSALDLINKTQKQIQVFEEKIEELLGRRVMAEMKKRWTRIT